MKAASKKFFAQGYTCLKGVICFVMRDMYSIRKHMFELFINSCFFTLNQFTLFIFLFPLYGISPTLTVSMSVAALGQFWTTIGFHRTAKNMFAIQNSNFVAYQAILPISKRILYSAACISCFIEIALQTFIPCTVGFGLLFLFFKDVIDVHWMSLSAVIGISLIFISTLFTSCMLGMSLNDFQNNIWTHCLTPLFLFGCSYYSLKQAFTIFPRGAYIFLINPFTYIFEGLRLGLTKEGSPISLTQCIVVLSLASCFNIWLLRYRFIRKFDLP